MRYEVRYYDHCLMIDLVGYNEARDHKFVLIYPLRWSPMLRRDGSLSFDDVSGKLVSAYITCADLLHDMAWFREAYVALFGMAFWDECVQLMADEYDGVLSQPIEIELSGAVREQVAARWRQLYELAADVQIEWGQNEPSVEQPQARLLHSIKVTDPERFALLTGLPLATGEVS